MADLNFYAGEDFLIGASTGSGIGFYGTSFGMSVAVGSWQDRSFITNSAGSAQGAETDNIKYANASSGIIGQAGSGIALTCIPNYLATCNVRFTNDAAVQVQNAKLRIYDRNNTNNPPSGLTCMTAELLHTSLLQTNVGSGDTGWLDTGGSGSVLTLANSPGISGLWAGNGSTSVRPDTRHDWYVAISASPNTIGSRPFAAAVSVEYL